MRHSGAEESEIRLDFNGADLWVTVADRGGFDVARSTRAGRPTRSRRAAGAS